ncbi:hypothetical protein GCM10010968_22690 [Agrococcus terreus]|uniref:HTH luxR-type domain-containing protein n=1 Tax=Agrococcus terreus TaxID=574649 RepID=A0ABQ2KPR4_9MICO|nr:hypothetical protein GCM10010968_22690 [Agrococcus terreus]
MSATEAPSDRAPRSVTAVATGTAADALRDAIAEQPALRLEAVEGRFTDLVTADGFPGDAIVLIEEPGPPLLAHARTAIAAGAVVVVLVDAEPSLADELAEAGAVVLPADTDGYALSASIRDARHPGRRRGRMGVGPARPRLSPRERRALAYYVQGRTTVQVADEMQVGYETAKTFLRRVRAKYAALDRPAGKRSELIVRAEEDGIL